jgi:O-antigen ligase
MRGLAGDAGRSRGRRHRRGGMIFLVFAAILALLPLPLGAARPLAWDSLALIVAMLLLASLGLSAEFHKRQAVLIGPALLLLAVALFVLAQTGSWTPSSWQNPLWQQAREALREPLPGSIAADPAAARVHLLRLMSYAGCFYLAFILASEADRAESLLKLVGISGSLYAAYGLAAYWAGNRSLLWLPKWAYPDDLTGPFVNRNSFASYLGLCLVALLCQLLHGFEALHLAGGRRMRVGRLIAFVSGRARLIVCLFILVVALLLTHSRGGFVSALAALLALALILLLSRPPGRFRPLPWIALLGMVIALAFLVSGGPTLARILGTNVDAEERLAVYRQVLAAIGDYPYLGAGFGSFASIFPLYRTDAVQNLYDLAHNDYLETILELGRPAALCLFAALLWLAALCLRGVRLRRHDGIFPAAAIAASVLVAVDSAVDFSLQIPAVAATYMTLLGVGVAQSRSSRAGRAGTRPSRPGGERLGEGLEPCRIPSEGALEQGGEFGVARDGEELGRMPIPGEANLIRP